MPTKKLKSQTEEQPLAEVAVPFRRLLVSPEQPPKAANAFNWVRVGQEYVLEVGHCDLVAVREGIEAAKKKEKVPEVDLFVVERFAFGRDTAERLVKSIEELRQDLVKLGEKAKSQGKER